MRALPRRRSGPGAAATAWTGGALLALATLTGCGSLPPPVPAPPTITPAASADGVTTVRFDYRPGSAPPAATVVAVPRGAVVDLVVGSDVTERVSLQGYGWSRYVTAGSTVSLRFVVDRPGELAVTVGDSGIELGRLQVRS